MSEFKRQHPAAAIDRLYTVIRKNFITYIVLFFLGTQSSDPFFTYILVFTLFWSFVSGIMSWWMFRYRIEGDELQLKSGLFVKKSHYLTKDRIQVIDITEGVVQRLFGLVKVEIKTAGSGTETATIRALTREQAEDLKNQLRLDSNSEQNEESIAFDVNNEVLDNTISETEDISKTSIADKTEILSTWKLSQKQLIMAGVTSGSFGLIASILGAIMGQMNLFLTDENIDKLFENANILGGYLIIMGLIIAILIVSWLLSFLGVIFKYYGFKLQKTEKELIITSGLLERKQIMVPYNRIQAIRFVEGAFRQPLKHGMLYVESAGSQMEASEKSITLVPYLSKTELDGFLAEFLSEYKRQDFDIKPPKRAIFKYIRFPNYFYVFIALALWYLFDFTWQLILPIPVLSFLGWLQFKDAGMYFSNDDILIQSRFLARETAFLKKKRVQAADQSINPFQKWRKLATLGITTASGADGIKFKIKDIDTGDSASIINRI